MTRGGEAKTTIRIRSRHVKRDVTCARWGHAGPPVLLFPTAGGTRRSASGSG